MSRESQDQLAEVVRRCWEILKADDPNPLRTILVVERQLAPGPRAALFARHAAARAGEAPPELSAEDVSEILRTPDERDVLCSESDLIRVELDDWREGEDGAGFVAPARLRGEPHRLFYWARARIPAEVASRSQLAAEDDGTAPVFLNHSDVVDALCPDDEAAREAMALYAFEISSDGRLHFFGASSRTSASDLECLADLVARTRPEFSAPGTNDDWKLE